jgi:hypothetical protein
MEAMSIETLLLSAWEEEGFVGKTRVPLAMSDVDVLAIHAGKGVVRFGESKVREGSQRVYVVDEGSMAFTESEGRDFASWLEAAWAGWLENLPRLWDSDGQPAVPWLLPASRVTELQVILCCNLWVFCDPHRANDSLRRTVLRFLEKHPSLAPRLSSTLRVKARVMSTIEVVLELIRHVFGRIKGGYGRRFADPFKDVFREVHRYLRPELYRVPWAEDGRRVGSRKAPFAARIRRDTALQLLRGLGVGMDELRDWIAEPEHPGAL